MQRTTMVALGSVLALATLVVCGGAGFAQTVSDSNAHANSNSNSNSNANSNQHQSQGQAVTYNETTPANQTIKNVPNVYAPGLAAAGSEVCLGSLSAGGAAAGFGLTVGGTMVDQECQLRMNARTLATLGYAVAAREEMCIDPQVRAAMLAAGTPCAADRGVPRGSQATAEYDGPAAQTTVARTVDASAVASAPAPGCHKEYQFIGGWHDVCPPGGKAAYALAENTADEVVAPASAPPAAPGCTKRYQLIGGWYDDCK